MHAAEGTTAARRLIACGVVFVLAVILTAVSGCWSSTANQAVSKLKDKKPERPFEDLRVFTEPNERSSYDPQAKAKDDQRITLVTKPGHWTGVLVQGRANLFDFDGVLRTTPQDAQQRPVDLERSAFWLSTTRGITLPKAQRKTFETLFFAPRPAPNSPVKGSTWIANNLTGRSGGQTLDRVPEMVSHMPSFQYFMVVLANQSAPYKFLNGLAAVRLPLKHTPGNVLDGYFYRVQFPPVDQPLALSAQPLCWTSTAVVLWDNVLPAALSPEQQRALVDWLHWGGSLIVSGPDSLDKLRGSFLDAYLPASGDTAGPIDAGKLAELHSTWSVSGDNSVPLGSRAGAGWSGLELAKHDVAEYVSGTGGLVAVGKVGRGRIVVTAFRLSEPDLVNWPSFDSFFNACLLGHPSREFIEDDGTFKYAGENPPDLLDSAVVTGVRYLTRDAREPARPGEMYVSIDQTLQYSNSDPTGAFLADVDLIDQLKGIPGTAGWNDFSWISTNARQTLQEAAGITVPQRQFVLKMIGLYLLVIVPINWLVFRLAGRVEWAWAAVPVIAVLWGVLVVWLAQLDIGFARAQIEVDVLEVQPAYARGHLTRYTALYSSLSSDYDLRFDDPSAVALPFSTDRERLAGQSSSGVTLTSVGERDLSDYLVASNSTGMIHGEQMINLGGAIVWKAADDGANVLENQSRLKLSGAALIRRRMVDDKPLDEIAWLGDVEPGQSTVPKFVPFDKKKAMKQHEASQLTAASTAPGTLSLRRLLDCVQDHNSLPPGEVRLVAWMDGAMGSLQVSPTTAQSRAATLIVAHLEYGRTEPVKDKNLCPLARLHYDGID